MTAEISPAKRKFKIAVVTTLGAISGIVSAYLSSSLLLTLGAISTYLFLPGLIFGFVVSIVLIICLKSKTSAVIVRAVLAYLITVTAGAASSIAGVTVGLSTGTFLNSAIRFKDYLIGSRSEEFYSYIITAPSSLIGGFIAGLVGAATLFRGCALMVPALRRYRMWRPSVAIGVITGVFFCLALTSLNYCWSFDFNRSICNRFLISIFIFPPWQMAFAFWLGYALTTSSESEDARISVSDRNKDDQIRN